MKFYECDRCGQRLPVDGKGREARWCITIKGPSGCRRRYDLCGWCAAALMEWSRYPRRRAARAKDETIAADLPGQVVAFEIT